MTPVAAPTSGMVRCMCVAYGKLAFTPNGMHIFCRKLCCF